MIEAEAKTKWCPMVHTRITAIFNQENRDSRLKAEAEADKAKCIGSVCMMWRNVVTENGTVLSDGHCGLAGKP